MWTIDASVWVNGDSSREPNSADSREFLDKVLAAGADIIVPTILCIEVAAAVARERNNQAIGQAFAARILSLAPLRWVTLDLDAATAVATFATEHRLRAADSVYAAVALHNHCTLVSLDREHLTRLTGVVNVVTPTQALETLF